MVFSLLALAGLLDLVAANPAGCECTGVNNGVNVATYGAEYGTSCAAWEDGLYEGNTKHCGTYGGVGVGTFCCRSWCYVDPATCDGVSTPFFASFAAAGSTAPTLYYSYDACDGVTPPPKYSAADCPWQGPDLYIPDQRIVAAIRKFGGTDHPDFAACGGCGPGPGCVADTLGPNGKPRLRDGWEDGSCSGFTSSDLFTRWFDDPVASYAPLDFCMNADTGNHEFDWSGDFLPGAAASDPQGLFTTEIRSFFRYNGGERFDFRGDDDVFVFIGGKLVIDLGGCHPAQSASVSLDSLGLVIGQNYEIALFHAERCYGESNFRAAMTLRADQGVCINQCNFLKEQGECDKDAGRCVCYDGWGGVDCGTPTRRRALVLDQREVAPLRSCPFVPAVADDISAGLGAPQPTLLGVAVATMGGATLRLLASR